jgi:mannose-6-phosphate isomerase-like protein (cupin superfamily)
MQSVKVRFASIALLIGVLSATRGTQAVDKGAVTSNVATKASASAVVQATETDTASSPQSPTPEASSFLQESSSGSRFFYWDASAFKATFNHKPGTPFLFSGEGGRRNFEVHTFHREKPGQVEYHALNWDVVYVVDGSATFVVGGTGLVNPKQIGPNEFTGSDIAGGPTRTVHLKKGDFYMVPTGVPHWYKEVQGSVDYIIIKIRDGSVARSPMDGKAGYCSETTGGTNVTECK